MTTDKLAQLDRTLKKLAGVCGILAGTAFAGLIPAGVGVVIAIAGVICAAASSSPLLDPADVGKIPVLSRIFGTLAVVASAVASSSFFPQVQHLFSDGHAQKIAVAVGIVAQVFAYLAQSPSDAVQAVGAAGKASVVLLLGLALTVSSCAHVTPYVGPVVSCVGVDIAPYAAEVAADLATGNYADLDALAVTKGVPFVACVIHAFLAKTNAGEATRRGSEWLVARDVRFAD